MEHIFKNVCNKCGGFDYLDINGTFMEKHNCEFLNTNQLLLRIAVALEKIERGSNAIL